MLLSITSEVINKSLVKTSSTGPTVSTRGNLARARLSLSPPPSPFPRTTVRVPLPSLH